MSTPYTQMHRPMEVITPLGKDVLLLVGFSGHEAIPRSRRNYQDDCLESSAMPPTPWCSIRLAPATASAPSN